MCIIDIGTVSKIIYYSRPPNTADLETDEKAAVFGNRRYLGARRSTK